MANRGGEALKEIKRLAAAMRKRGWTIEKGKNHLIWRDENGKYRFSSSASPSDPYAAKNVRRDLIRCNVKDI